MGKLTAPSSLLMFSVVVLSSSLQNRDFILQWTYLLGKKIPEHLKKENVGLFSLNTRITFEMIWIQGVYLCF